MDHHKNGSAAFEHSGVSLNKDRPSPLLSYSSSLPPFSLKIMPSSQRGCLQQWVSGRLSEHSFIYKIFFGPDPNKVRPKVLLMITFLCIVNIMIWVVAVLVYKPYPSMIGTGALAYTLGLRHAVDAGLIKTSETNHELTLPLRISTHRSYLSH